MQIPPVSIRRRRLSLTPLIDVIFLLLLFFMLSSTFSQYSEIAINSGSGGSAEVRAAELLFLTLDADGMKLDGKGIPRETLPDEISLAENLGKKSIVLVVAVDVTSQELISHLRIINLGQLPVSVARRSK